MTEERSRQRRWLPARLDDAGDFALEAEVSEADAAHGELAQVATNPPADQAAVILPDRKLLLPLELCDQRFFCQEQRSIFNKG